MKNILDMYKDIVVADSTETFEKWQQKIKNMLHDSMSVSCAPCSNHPTSHRGGNGQCSFIGKWEFAGHNCPMCGGVLYERRICA